MTRRENLREGKLLVPATTATPAFPIALYIPTSNVPTLSPMPMPTTVGIRYYVCDMGNFREAREGVSGDERAEEVFHSQTNPIPPPHVSTKFNVPRRMKPKLHYALSHIHTHTHTHTNIGPELLNPLPRTRTIQDI